MSSHRDDSTALEHWTQTLIRRAAQRAGAPFAERLEEEWLADLATRDGAPARLRLVLGCCWPARIISSELAPLGAVAADSAGGPRMATPPIAEGLAFISRRTLAVIVILGAHLAVLYALATALVHRDEGPPSALRVDFLADPLPARAHPPPVPPPRLHDPRPPVVVLQDLPPVPADAPPARLGEPDPPPHARSPLVPPPLERLIGGPGAGFPRTDDYYPAAARRLGEKGAALVAVCVDATGHLSAPPSIAESSGNPRLDEGALRLAQAGSGRYRPTTENGKAVSFCYPLRIRFELRD
jgi:TonB family protein